MFFKKNKANELGECYAVAHLGGKSADMVISVRSAHPYKIKGVKEIHRRGSFVVITAVGGGAVISAMEFLSASVVKND